jgi:hypothetical protein
MKAGAGIFPKAGRGPSRGYLDNLAYSGMGHPLSSVDRKARYRDTSPSLIRIKLSGPNSAMLFGAERRAWCSVAGPLPPSQRRGRSHPAASFIYLCNRSPRPPKENPSLGEPAGVQRCRPGKVSRSIQPTLGHVGRHCSNFVAARLGVPIEV